MAFDLLKRHVSALIRFQLEFIEDSLQYSNQMPIFSDLGLDKVFPNILCSSQKGLIMLAVNMKFCSRYELTH